MFASAFVSGLLFGLGLLLAGMSNPAKVLAFLDVAGAWDPSLALVMVGGIVVAAIGFIYSRGRDKSLLGEPLHWPLSTGINGRLVIGSLVFGAGWGLAGVCPGPALVLLAQGKAVIFALAMFAGMGLHTLLNRRR